MKITENPNFNVRIFWDVDSEKMDFDKKSHWVIARVFERGDVDDIRHSRRYYGDELIRQVLLNVKFLPEHRLHLASAVINEPPENFRCYTSKPLNQRPQPY